ncbi:hypothetical protein YA0783_22365 [Pseudomonas corrugata]|jgi:hypothetical protein|nr:hypothetical protein [Pseudomonas corrugata]MBI6621048.1 hypothetical protein [Pseudomonas corrugata]MBI6694043.1 hypothetical protein [Pseudomonas corrugata]
MKDTIAILVCLHDDLKGYEYRKLSSDHFVWLKTELELISGREVIITFARPQPPYSHLRRFDYKGADASSKLSAWRNAAQDWRYETLRNNDYDPRLTKTLLLTKDNINKTISGIAELGGHFGIASIRTYNTPAHEIGHLFNADHKDSVIEYDGWWKDSIMHADSYSDLRGNTYRFSESNRENIRQYLMD